jgi:hypothetical protein
LRKIKSGTASFHVLSRRKAAAAGQKEIKSRIEDVLDCQVAVTSSGQFFRLDGDRRVDLWLRTVENFDAKGQKQFLDRFDCRQRRVFAQVRSPNAFAHVFAYLERGSSGWVHGTPLSKSMTIDCLAEGMSPRMAPGLFIEILKSLAERLAAQIS